MVSECSSELLQCKGQSVNAKRCSRTGSDLTLLGTALAGRTAHAVRAPEVLVFAGQTVTVGERSDLSLCDRLWRVTVPFEPPARHVVVTRQGLAGFSGLQASGRSVRHWS